VIVDRLYSLLKQRSPEVKQPIAKIEVPKASVAAQELTKEFQTLALSLTNALGKEVVDIFIEEWHHNESSLAVESLIDLVLEMEPLLSKEQQISIAKFATLEDQFHEQQWQRYTAEMTPEELKKREITDPRTTFLAEFRQVYPE